MANSRVPSVRQESAQQEIERNRQLDAHNRAQAARDSNGGRSAPHSQAETAGGLSSAKEWDSRNTPSANFNRLKPLPLTPYTTIPAPPVLTTAAVNPLDAEQRLSASPAAAPAAGNVPRGTFNPDANSIANPPPMDNLTGSWNKGATVPEQATNYLGESRYIDPHANGAMVSEIDPAKDMRYSVNGQTSGANTAAGILSKYQTPGTTASFTPGTVTDAGGNVANNGQTVFNRASAETALKASHPNIFTAGSPENTAFVAHAQQYGEPSAHANVDSIMQGVKQNPGTAGTAQVAAGPKPMAQEQASTPQVQASEGAGAMSASAQPPARQAAPQPQPQKLDPYAG